LNVKTFRIDSRSKMKSSRSLRLYLLSLEVGSDSRTKPFRSACLGLKLVELSLLLPSDSSSFVICLGVSLSVLLSSSRCLFINSSISSSSSLDAKVVYLLSINLELLLNFSSFFGGLISLAGLVLAGFNSCSIASKSIDSRISSSRLMSCCNYFSTSIRSSIDSVNSSF